MIPIVLALVLWKVLPESPRYLASRRERWPELTRTMRRIGHDVPGRRDVRQKLPQQLPRRQ